MEEIKSLAKDQEEVNEFSDMIFNIVDVFTPEQLGIKVSSFLGRK